MLAGGELHGAGEVDTQADRETVRDDLVGDVELGDGGPGTGLEAEHQGGEGLVRVEGGVLVAQGLDDAVDHGVATAGGLAAVLGEEVVEVNAGLVDGAAGLVDEQGEGIWIVVRGVHDAGGDEAGMDESGEGVGGVGGTAAGEGGEAGEETHEKV